MRFYREIREAQRRHKRRTGRFCRVRDGRKGRKKAKRDRDDLGVKLDPEDGDEWYVDLAKDNRGDGYCVVVCRTNARGEMEEKREGHGIVDYRTHDWRPAVVHPSLPGDS